MTLTILRHLAVTFDGEFSDAISIQLAHGKGSATCPRENSAQIDNQNSLAQASVGGTAGKLKLQTSVST